MAPAAGDTPRDAARLPARLLAAARGVGQELTHFLAPGVALGDVIRELASLASAPGVQLGAPLVNGLRIDVAAFGPDGQEWWLVLELAEAGGPSVKRVSVFERPAPFGGVPGGFAIVLRGPSSSGKSSLMAAVGAQAPTPWVAFDEPVVGTVPLRFLIWPDAQGPLDDGFFSSLSALARAGNQVITSAGVYPEGRFRTALAGAPSLFVRLDCPLEVLLERQGRRDDRWAGLAEETIAREDGWSYDLRIDTAANTPDAAARILLARVAELQAPDGTAVTGRPTPT